MQNTPSQHMAPLAYDVGLNNGCDTAYYLAKGWRVVAIDADSGSCNRAKDRFSAELEAGKLTILNVGVGRERATASFFVNEAESAFSTFLPERFANMAWVKQMWRETIVEIWCLSDLIAIYGCPDYIKIDVEFYDTQVLTDLANARIKPRFLSVEVHQEEVLNALLRFDYDMYRIVRCETIPEEFGNVEVHHADGSCFYRAFTDYSSGPFGDDLAGPWIDRTKLSDALQEVGLGWIDIHATNSRELSALQSSKTLPRL